MGQLGCVKKACRINDLIFDKLVKDFNFKTEKNLERFILREFRNAGVGRAYSPIVANNYSKIHAVPRRKKFRRGFLVLDFGARVDGWCSDMTRTIFLGKANKEEKELYNLVLGCQRRCVEKVGIGVSCFELEVLARKLLGDYRGKYRHWLGHGIGKKVHQNPRFGIFTTDLVKKGDIIAIEPGIYMKDKKKEFGIRVEDTIYVGRKVEVLSKAPKNFIEIEGF
jgi:Xaa-Pro aminopeptidase